MKSASSTADHDDAAGYSHPMAQHLGFLLRRVQLAVVNDFQLRTAGFNLTPTEYSILEVVHATPDMQQNQLAEVIGVKPANCVLLITSLEGRRLLARGAAKHPGRGRAVALRLTAEGKKLLKKMNLRVAAHQQFVRQLLGEAAHEELRAHLLFLLEQIDQGRLG